MSHDLDFSNGQWAVAYLGSRDRVWHRLGQEMPEGAPLDQWIKSAGLNWEVRKVPAIAHLAGEDWDHIGMDQRFQAVDGRAFLARSDTGKVLGYASEDYKTVQPREVFDWFERYIGVDDRFQLDAGGALKGGALIWATAKFREPMSVAGDEHVARLLMSTSFDGSQATRNEGTMTRVICRNTLRMAQTGSKAVVSTRHSTAFNASQVSRELASICQGFEQFKKVGDAMAQVEMTAADVSAFFKELLEIPFDAKREDVSTRKMNQFAGLSRAYTTTLRETESHTDKRNVWDALQAVTRYVDHEDAFSTDHAEKRFASTTFGHGDALKGQAMSLLMPRVRELVPVAA